MDVRQTLICFFFFTLRGRNTGLINAEIISTGTEGGNITVGCIFTFSGKRKIFCKEPCEEHILIETEDVTAQRGRYSITYTEGAYPVRSTVLYVSITKLTKSDAGKYRCGLHRSLPLLSPYSEIEIRVEEAPISSKPNVTLKPLSASVPSASTQNTTQLSSSTGSYTPSSASTQNTTQLSSSTGSYTPSSASPEGTQQSQRDQTPAAATGVLMYVGLTLVIMIVVVLAAVVIICRKRASESKEPPVETEYANDTEANRVYEDIREEDRRSTSPPVEVSTLYTYVKYAKPHAVETSDEYSLATAATSQKPIEDASSKLIYSDVDFADGPAASLHSAPCGNADNVIYSVPRVEDTSPPLYSIVTSHQP
ncbi:uncharacterized protein LOC142955747 isoform X2 [Anarhichas minor]|uniref:uncharacterized protein LOC142955747 isoform X2 n=1 Tax=Anarhichas minor TaxID=65739 RepID=UPI003F7313B4